MSQIGHGRCGCRRPKTAERKWNVSQESRDGCVSNTLSLQLQKSPTPNSRKSAEIPPTFQRAFLNRECASSNPPRSARQCGRPRFNLNRSQKSPPMAAFRNSVAGLQTPDFTDCGPKWPKVSGHLLNYSRFPETPTGDRVRSALRGGPGSAVLSERRSNPRIGWIQFVFCLYRNQASV